MKLARLRTNLMFAASLSAAAISAQTVPQSRPLIQPAELAASLELPDAPLAQLAPPPALPPAADSSSTAPDTSSPATPTPTPAALSAAQAAAQARQQTHDQAERELQAEEKQRVLGVLPQFNVVLNGQAVPLSAGQKFQLAAHTAIDPFYIGYAFIAGGFSEISGSDNGYHWGPAGYFKRVGSNYADNVNGALIGNALLPILLHQDPRYFRMGTGPKKKRFIYAALSTVICRGDNGKQQFNISNVLGNFISGAISNAYYPADQRGLGLTLENGLDVTLFGAVGGQLLEFAPDLVQHFKNRHKALPATSSSVTPQPSSVSPIAPPPANP